MSIRSIIRVLSRASSLTLCGSVIAAASFATPLPAQVPPVRRAAADTAKKKVVQRARKPAVKEPVIRQEGGEIAPPCVDESAKYERQRALDSVVTEILLRARIRDVQTAANAARERDRQDAIARDEAAKAEAERTLRQHLARGVYLRLGGGASTPLRDTRNGYSSGWNAVAGLGWDATDAPYGFRGDIGIDRLNGMRYVDQAGRLSAAGGDISIYSVTGDVKLRVHPPAVAETRSHLYAIGGIGMYKVADGVYGPVGDRAGERLSFNDARVNFGFNIGGGVSLEVGRAELFVESRFVQIRTELSYRTNGGVGTYTSMMPIVVGLHW